MNHRTFKHLENEIYSYHKTKQDIEQLKLDIIYSTPTPDENIGGGRSSLPGRPTETKTIALRTDRRLRRLEMVTEAIEAVYESLDDEKKKLMYLRYWKRPTIKLEGIALELNISSVTAGRWRTKIVHDVGALLGYI